jgi:protein-S-isoprenylcysteine O-methyltransferase Ste14
MFHACLILASMKHMIEVLVRFVLLGCIVCLWSWVVSLQLSNVVNLLVIVGGALLMIPLVWVGRKILDRHHTGGSVAWITTFVHCAIGVSFGVALMRALITHHDWTGWVLPVPAALGVVLVVISGAASLLTVITLALKGLGAPFFVALSQKLASDWVYAWTRNPMLLAGFAFALSPGIMFQSTLFIAWVLIVVIPEFLFFVKVYEERELEFRFGDSYLEYRSRTPMLFPGKSQSRTTRKPSGIR